jgi:ubiquinone/menaquinone biosynthesis C-methylase UbiE
MYNPLDYWQKRGENYGSTMHDIAAYLPALYKQAQDCKRVLDIGAGWGRVYLYFRLRGFTGAYTMVDFVDSMRLGCQALTGILPDGWDGVTLPYQPGSFDAALLVFVLQHTPDPQTIISEARRVASRLIILDTSPSQRISAEHCFAHNWQQVLGVSAKCLLDDGVVSLWTC